MYFCPIICVPVLIDPSLHVVDQIWIHLQSICICVCICTFTFVTFEAAILNLSVFVSRFVFLYLYLYIHLWNIWDGHPQPQCGDISKWRPNASSATFSWQKIICLFSFINICVGKQIQKSSLYLYGHLVVFVFVSHLPGRNCTSPNLGDLKRGIGNNQFEQC